MSTQEAPVTSRIKIPGSRAGPVPGADDSPAGGSGAGAGAAAGSPPRWHRPPPVPERMMTSVLHQVVGYGKHPVGNRANPTTGATYPRVPHGPQRGSSSEVRGEIGAYPATSSSSLAPAATAPVARPAGWPSLGPAPTAPARRRSRSAGSSRPGWRGRAGSGVAGPAAVELVTEPVRLVDRPGRSSRWPCRTVRPPARRRHCMEGIVDRLRDQGHEPLSCPADRQPTDHYR